jgi:hypothetical protein
MRKLSATLPALTTEFGVATSAGGAEVRAQRLKSMQTLRAALPGSPTIQYQHLFCRAQLAGCEPANNARKQGIGADLTNLSCLSSSTNGRTHKRNVDGNK